MKHRFALLANAYGTPAMREVWAEENMVQKWLDMELAITKAKAEVGIISKENAEGIIKNSTVEVLTPQMIADVKSGAAHLIVSFIKAFAKAVQPWGEHYHVGPTTQDILDTGATLQIREAYAILMKQLRELEAALMEKAIEHKNTVMMGRTHGQHAVPVTFGFKCAIWAGAIRDHIDRFKEIQKRLLTANISAAVGASNTFTYLVGPEKAEKIQDIVSAELKLGRPVMDTHQRMDRFAEYVNHLNLIMMTLAQMGLEIRDLQSTELQEVEEPFDSKNQYSSSTMPNKRNPEPSEWNDGLANIVRGCAVAMSSVTMQHERDATRMASIFGVIPEASLIVSAALATAIKNINGLIVHADNMKRNLYVQNGIAMAEVLLMALYKKTGQKVTMHTLVHDVSMKAFDERRSFLNVCLEDTKVSSILTKKEIEDCLDPEHYYGTADIQAVNMVNYCKERRATDAEVLKQVGIDAENNYSVFVIPKSYDAAAQQVAAGVEK
ncbi:MAG: lyase family protein [Desulfitobacteriaceae bacterium]